MSCVADRCFCCMIYAKSTLESFSPVKHNYASSNLTKTPNKRHHCRRDQTTSAANRLEHCITDVGSWMSANRLKLNTDKTELLWAGSRFSNVPLGNLGKKRQILKKTNLEPRYKTDCRPCCIFLAKNRISRDCCVDDIFCNFLPAR